MTLSGVVFRVLGLEPRQIHTTFATKLLPAQSSFASKNSAEIFGTFMFGIQG
jgi:hypothetical protein